MASTDAQKPRVLIDRCVVLTLGLLFVVAAVAKALGFTAFTVQIAYYGIVREPWLIQSVAISTILLETILGVALLTGTLLRGWTLRAIFLLLVFFSGLLVYGWIVKDLEECGCFGPFLKMSPAAALLKNAAMMIAVACAWRRSHAGDSRPAFGGSLPQLGIREKIAAMVLVSALVCTSFAYHIQTRADFPTWEASKNASKTDSGSPFARLRFEVEGKQWDLGKGEYFVAFLSDSCDHCEADFRRLNALRRQLRGRMPIVVLVLGEEESLERLRKRTRPEFLNLLIPPLRFFSFVGDAPPRFYYVHSGQGIKYWDKTLPRSNELLEASSRRSGSRSILVPTD